MIFSMIGIIFLAPQLGVVNLWKYFLRPRHSVCMVVTDQEDVEIYVNGKKAPRKTPCLVKIKKEGESTLVLKKKGYQDHRVQLKSQHELSFYYCQLKRFELRLLDPQKLH
jgi:PEGA domain